MKTIWIWSNVAKSAAVWIVGLLLWLAVVWALDLSGGVGMIGGMATGFVTAEVGLIFWKPWRFD